jgi:hypothetical protein
VHRRGRAIERLAVGRPATGPSEQIDPLTRHCRNRFECQASACPAADTVPPPRTPPSHSRRSLTHQSSWPAFDSGVIALFAAAVIIATKGQLGVPSRPLKPDPVSLIRTPSRKVRQARLVVAA